MKICPVKRYAREREGSLSARWLTSLVPVKRYHHVAKSDLRKTLQKTLKFSDCRESIRQQIRPSCRKIFRVRFVFVWFRENSEIQRFQRIFGLDSKCLCKELPPLSNFIHKAKKNFAECGKA